MKHIVLFSGGVQSAYVAHLVVQQHGKEDTILLWHDPKAEDVDNRRFVFEMAGWLGVPVTERSDGRSPWELFEDEKFLGNNRVPLCSRILKREQGLKFIKHEMKGIPFILYFGYGREEPRRVQKVSQLYGVQGIKTAFPLFTGDIDRDAAWSWLLTTGIKPPRIYQTLQHANCVGCIRAGRGHWWAVWKHHPVEYERAAKAERDFGHTIISDISLDALSTRFREDYKPKSTEKEGKPCECWE